MLPPVNRRMLSRAFQRLPEAARCLLWHVEVEAEPLAVPAGLLGLEEDGARGELSRSRERLREECLQVHRELATDDECHRYHRLLDVTCRRGGGDLDPDLRTHLDGCRHCTHTADQLLQFEGLLGAALAEGVLGWAAAAYVETFRSVPLVLLMFFSLFALPKWGIDFVSPYWAVVIGLVAYNSAVFAEIFRAGIRALPKGQTEAAASIGLRYWQSMRFVVVPQALRAMIPALVAQLVVLLKDTSLGALLAYEELLRRGQITGEYARNPLQALFVAGLLYVPIVFSLNRLARWLELRQRRGPVVIVDDATAQALLDAQLSSSQPAAVAELA
jgi:His/Glu/Gln/Arg/opine family amino acid ABC transporter permease subunit